jgi:hypothetical protein
VPSTKPLFFPVINVACSTVEPDPFHGDNEAELRACAQVWMDGAGIGSLKASVDGAEVHALSKYRFQSPLFDFRMPAENNALFVPGATSGSSVSDGYWLLLEPLSAGSHVVHFEGAITSGPGAGGKQNITYNLTVR